MAEDKPLKTFGPYDKELGVFTSIMRYKLERNAHKGRWETLDLAKTLELLRGEMGELERAIASGATMDILLEAADVANQALIAAMVAIRPKKDAADGITYICEVDYFGGGSLRNPPSSVRAAPEPIKNLHPATIGLPGTRSPTFKPGPGVKNLHPAYIGLKEHDHVQS